MGERIQRYKSEIYMRRFKLMERAVREVGHEKVERRPHDIPSKSEICMLQNKLITYDGIIIAQTDMSVHKSL